jgi:regulator of replication initiation timing
LEFTIQFYQTELDKLKMDYLLLVLSRNRALELENSALRETIVQLREAVSFQ